MSVIGPQTLLVLPVRNSIGGHYHQLDDQHKEPMIDTKII